MFSVDGGVCPVQRLAGTAAGVRTDPGFGPWVIFKLGAGRTMLQCDDHPSPTASSPIHWYDGDFVAMV